VDEIVKAVGAQSRVVKGLLTRLEKEGRVRRHLRASTSSNRLSSETLIFFINIFQILLNPPPRLYRPLG
jgi:DNA-binding transcriptional regulator PaaX